MPGSVTKRDINAFKRFVKIIRTTLRIIIYNYYTTLWLPAHNIIIIVATWDLVDDVRSRKNKNDTNFGFSRPVYERERTSIVVVVSYARVYDQSNHSWPTVVACTRRIYDFPPSHSDFRKKTIDVIIVTLYAIRILRLCVCICIRVL